MVWRRLGPLVLGVAALATAAVAPASAQSTTGGLTGVVRDAEGGVIPGVDVRARHEGTNAEQAAVSDAQGVYVLRGLPLGAYTVTAELSGFQTFQAPGVVVRVNEEVRLDVRLQVGALTETVEVSGAASTVDTVSSTLKTVVDRQRIEELPLNGRNPTQLMTLVAGVQTDPRTSLTSGSTYPGVQPVSSSGARGNTTNYVLDGGSNNDHYSNAPNPMPNPDALQEFSVQTNAFSAEYGRNVGAVVNAVTRSGTNSVHGVAFGYLRHHRLNATNFFTPGQDDGLERYQFGGTLGGPIVRDRTFFFGSYQGTDQRSRPTSRGALVPTAAMRRGDFSALDQQLQNPYTGEPFPNNQIPTSRFSPVATAIMDEWVPLPNPAPGEPDMQLTYEVPSELGDHQYLTRIDHRFSNTHALYGRVWVSRASQPAFLADGNVLANDFGRTWQNTIVSVNDTYVLSPTLLNNLVVTFNRTNNDNFQIYPPSYEVLGIPDVYNDSTPQWHFNVQGYSLIGTGDTNQFLRNELQIANTLRWTRGRHELAFGGDYSYAQGDIVNNFRGNGRYTFSGAAPFTGDALADFFLGEFSQFEQGVGEYKRTRMHFFALFAQDTVRVSPKLTVNLGLRWDPFLPYTDPDGKFACFRPGQSSDVYAHAPDGALYPGDASCPNGGFDAQWLNVGPRLGLAYDPFGDGRTSVRAGYGLFYDRPNTITTNSAATQGPFGTVVRFDGDPDNSVTDTFAGRDNPFPMDPFNTPRDAPFVLPHNMFVYGDGYGAGRLHSWHLTLEREVQPTWLVRLAYAGSRGTNLGIGNELNPAIYEPGATTATTNERRPLAPTFGNIVSIEPVGRSSYHALQATVDKRFSDGFTLLASYTWAKALDHSSENKLNGVSQTNPFDLDMDWGPANFDRRHRLVASWLYELPGDFTNRLADVALGGWSATGIWTWQSGLPVDITSGVDNARSGTGGQRADLVGDPSLPSGRSRDEQIEAWLNTDAFAANALGTFGTVGRNAVRGPRFATLDLGLHKTFAVANGVRAQIRFEAFNALNNVTLDLPESNRSSGNFGRILGASDPRILQLALRVMF